VDFNGAQVRRPGLIRVGLSRHCRTNYKRQDYKAGVTLSLIY